MGKFMELKVWQRAKDLAVYIYKITREGDVAKDFGFKDQIRRAAVSIPSNIAAGDELGSNKQAVKLITQYSASISTFFDASYNFKKFISNCNHKLKYFF